MESQTAPESAETESGTETGPETETGTGTGTGWPEGIPATSSAIREYSLDKLSIVSMSPMRSSVNE